MIKRSYMAEVCRRDSGQWWAEKPMEIKEIKPLGEASGNQELVMMWPREK